MTTDPGLVAAYDYDLPDRLIAQTPSGERDESRLLTLNRENGAIMHKTFSDLPDLLNPGDLLVLNNTRVIPARLKVRRQSGARIELLILEGWRGRRTKALLRPAKRVKIGEILNCGDGWTARILGRQNDMFDVEFEGNGSWKEFLAASGEMPVPPYIHRSEHHPEQYDLDRTRYQTVYAECDGAVAAPTAGLHFSEPLLQCLRARFVDIATVTLHVGWGTFKPVKVTRLCEHVMESEYFSISQEAARKISRTKQEGGRVIAVGTTTTRALESWGMNPSLEIPVNMMETCLFITPGFRFRVIDALITNFHLPRSTLLMLVSAFAGRNDVLSAYSSAIKENYRFYSYGDAMFIY